MATKKAAKKKSVRKKRAKRGRPSQFRAALVNEFLSRMMEGKSVEEICRKRDMPAACTIHRWVAEKPHFRERYVQALRVRALIRGEQIVAVASKEKIPIETRRLMIDAMKFDAVKLQGPIYKEVVKQEVEHKIVNMVALDDWRKGGEKG